MTTATTHVITPRSWTHVGVRELWEYRELLLFLAWRDVAIRYKQTIFGIAWAILQPLLTMLIFVMLFGRFAGMESYVSGTPYALFVLCGLVPWTFFSNAVAASGNSIVANSALVTKVYFPRLLIPAAAVIAGIVDVAVSSVLLLGMMLYYGRIPGRGVFLAPLLLFAVVVFAGAVGTLTSALVVSYRDVRYALPFVLQIWMFLTPVAYPPQLVPGRWQIFLLLNPMSTLIAAFRGSLLGSPVNLQHLIAALVIVLALATASVLYFRHVERRFADVI